MLQLGHLNLTVADVDRSIAYYRDWFGFDRELARDEDGTVFVTDERGFELALHPGSGAPSDTWHFGFLADSADEVLTLAAHLDAERIEVIDRHESPAYTGFKTRDPDGYTIEVYHEPRA